jgi:cystathionine beta-lyase/cystathionine gamma-synthase
MRIDPHDVALCVADAEPDGHHEPLPTSPPIVQTSFFSFPTFQALLDGFADEFGSTIYTRGRNPTVRAVEEKLAALEGGEACCCFASGMAAVSAVMFGLLAAGDHVLLVNNVYGPTRKLASQLGRFGVEHDAVLDLDPEVVRSRLRPNTRLLWIESPGTFLFRVADLKHISAVAHEQGARVCCDNSWATPLLQKPLQLGADLVVHSATKYLAGHGDVVAGAAVSSEALMREIFRRASLLLGGVLAPFDAWLLLRGMRTLPARLRQHEADALVVARAAAAHTAVRAVHHPALGPERALAERLMTGYTGVFSLELARDDYDGVRTFIDALEHFRIGVSWGGVESLVISPQRPTNQARLAEHGLPSGLVRLSVGLEGADVLAGDVTRALDRVR